MPFTRLGKNVPQSFGFIKSNCVLLCCISLFGCKEITWHHSSVQKSTLGEAVYEIVYRGVNRTNECRDERLEPLVSERESFVESIDYILPAELRLPMQGFISESFLPLVDNDQLPPLSDTFVDLLQLLIDDERDPNRETLSAILNLVQTKSVLQPKHFFLLVEGLIHDPAIKTVLQSAAGLSLEHNGVDYSINEVFDLLARHLQDFSEEEQCNGLDLGNLEQTLLRTDLLPSHVDHGDPAWLVRTDVHGNPRVGFNPSTSSLHLPFIDLDYNGAADINEAGQPIDSNGEIIRILPLGKDGGRDEAGRALTSSNELVYEYFDAKRSGLTMLLILVREAISDKMHHDAVALINATLGSPQVCYDGTETCRRYSAADHPIADIVFLLMEIAKYDHAQMLLRTWSELINQSPVLAEEVLVAIGQVLERVEYSNVSLTDLTVIDLLQEALPLIAELFETPNTSGQSTGRLLMTLVHDLGQTARNLPEQLLTTIDYQSLYKEEACTDAKPDLERSVLVDYDLPRRYVGPESTVIDNRSGLEQSIELFSNVDCGSVPFTGGKTVAHFVLETIADMQPDSVCNLIDTLLGLVGVFPWMGEALTTTMLDIIGCDGDLVWRDLQTLDSLAKSGALDTYIPIAKVFVDHNQLDTLLGLFHLLAKDLRKNDDADNNTKSVVREMLPLISQIIQSGAIDKLFDLDDLLVTVPAVDGNGNAADVVVDSLERLLDSNSPISTRAGIRPNTSLAAETLKPLRTIVSRIATGPGHDALSNLASHVTGYLTKTEVDNQGTADPNDDRILLTNKRFIPLTQMALDFLVELLALPDTDRHCYLESFQSGSSDYFTSRKFAGLIRLMETFKNSPHGTALETAAIDFLDPTPQGETPDVLGPLVQIVSGLMQMSANDEDIQKLISYLGQALDPSLVDGRLAILTFNDLIESDEEEFLLSVLRNALYQGPSSLDDSALYNIASVLIDMAAVTPTNQCLENDGQWTVDEIEPHLSSIIDFMTDNEYGLDAIWKIIRARRGGVTTYE